MDYVLRRSWNLEVDQTQYYLEINIRIFTSTIIWHNMLNKKINSKYFDTVKQKKIVKYYINKNI